LQNEPTWLDAELLIAFNKRTVSDTGEPHHLRDRGLLESAVARPVNQWHYGERDMLALAVALLTGVGQNHPFLQGNKRTAFGAMEYFLYLNGYQLAVEDGDDLADLVIDLINGDVSEHSFIVAIEDLVTEA
jgi:death-on-curing protein